MDHSNEFMQKRQQQEPLVGQMQNEQLQEFQNQQLQNLQEQEQLDANQYAQYVTSTATSVRLAAKRYFLSACKRIARFFTGEKSSSQQMNDQIANIQNNPEMVEPVGPLHHSRGKQLIAEGQHVLEFDLAGSGFKHFSKPHKNLSGHDDYKKATQEEKDKLDAEYGERIKVAGKKRKYIRRKITKDENGNELKTRITMAGPQNIGGLLNKGKYDIESLRGYMLTLGSEYLENIFDTWDLNPELCKPINIIIKGHSRGAVAAGEGAMMLKAWVATKYTRYLNYVKFELTQYDPVPGLGSRSKHQEIDHAGDDVFIKNGVKMMPLGANAKTTVFYSMNTQYAAGFRPQAVHNANRVILTPFEHAVDLNKSENTQQGAHRMGYTDALTGNTYRNSGINELDEGLYVTTEDHTLLRMTTAKEAIEFVNDCRKLKDAPDDRMDILIDVILKWFAVHNNPQPAQA